MPRIHRTALAAVSAAALSIATVAAQQNVTQSDIQRLQDNVLQATTDVSQLRSRDMSRANELQTEIDDLREEVIYLKVKLRKEGSVVRSDYASVRDRIEDVRTRARGDSFYAAAPPASRYGTGQATSRGTTTSAARGGEIPAGTEMDVRLSGKLNSGTAAVEDRFEATTLVDVNVDGRTLVPAGSVMRGVVTDVQPGTRTNRTSKMTVSFDQLTVNGRSYPIRGTVTQAIEGEGIRGEAGRAGVGAGVGAIIGGILGGFKGAMVGILIGGGGTIAATEGKEVELPPGTVLRVRIDAPVQINQTTRY